MSYTFDKLTVTNQTTLADLQRFAEAPCSGDNLRARKVEGGWELYTRHARSSVPGRVLDTVQGLFQRSQIRAALSEVAAGHKRATGIDATRILFSNLKASHPNIKAGTLLAAARGDGYQALRLDARQLGKFEAVPRGFDKVLAEVPSRGPSAESLGLTSAAVTDSLRHLAVDLAAGGSLSEVTAEARSRFVGGMSAAIAEAFIASSPDEAQRSDFTRMGIGDGHEALTGLILTELKAAAGDEVTLPRWDFHETLAADILDRAAVAVSADRFTSDKEFLLDGVRYRHRSDLASGAFGKVSLFESEEGRQVAVKIPRYNGSDPEQRQQTFGLSLVEVDRHREAEAGGHDNVVHMIGAVRAPRGFAVVLELAGGGSLARIDRRLGNAVSDGVITKQERLLVDRNMVREMLAGANHSHQNEVMNGDIKPENFLLTSDGVVKLADHGAGQGFGSFDYRSAGPLTTRFKSPEVEVDRQAERDFHTTVGLAMDKANEGLAKRLDPLSEVKGMMPPRLERRGNPMLMGLVDSFERSGLSRRDALEAAQRDLLVLARDVMKSTMDPVKRDAFALGRSAIEMIPNRHSFEQYARGETGLSSYHDLDKLVDGLMADDFRRRLSPAEALEQDVLKLSDSEIGEARALMGKVIAAEAAKANAAKAAAAS